MLKVAFCASPLSYGATVSSDHCLSCCRRHRASDARLGATPSYICHSVTRLNLTCCCCQDGNVDRLAHCAHTGSKTLIPSRIQTCRILTSSSPPGHSEITFIEPKGSCGSMRKYPLMPYVDVYLNVYMSRFTVCQTVAARRSWQPVAIQMRNALRDDVSGCTLLLGMMMLQSTN